MVDFDYKNAEELLGKAYFKAQHQFYEGSAPPEPPFIQKNLKNVFDSKTQAYREVLLGCILARLIDIEIDIRKPYVSQGPNAFNGRTLDERVVNPFFHNHDIPSSKGPYLTVFRRSVELNAEHKKGKRDKGGYDSLLNLIEILQKKSGFSEIESFLNTLLYKFILLREASKVPLAKLRRISTEQYSIILAGLLDVPSGGLIPVLLVGCIFETIRICFHLDWEIEIQGINVADGPSKASGDITIKSGDEVILAVEVTERPVDRKRVVSTFTTKISKGEIKDYLFMTSINDPSDDAISTARQYFAQGHEIGFIKIHDWAVNILGTIGGDCREVFKNLLYDRLDEKNVPQALKAAWNEQVQLLLG